MYQTIYVPLDNSDHSNAAAELGLGLAKRIGARVVGSHAYAAALHDVRFKQMEFTLPDEYKDEGELEKQRRIHDSLITRGLQLISDSYLHRWNLRAEELGVAFEGKRFDGKNFEVIVKDIESSDYDLVILGALGQGAVKDSQVGSVCERVLRRTQLDTWVVRDLDTTKLGPQRPGTIVVCLDGSPHSLGGLRAACALAKASGKHVDVLRVGSGDEGVAQIDVALRWVERQGVSASATRLCGSPVRAILDHAARIGAWLLVVGRVGADSDDASKSPKGEASTDIGSLAERLVRRAPCDVFLSSRTSSLAAIHQEAGVA
jgi:nucleotide-binding universal stress UspA family protein